MVYSSGIPNRSGWELKPGAWKPILLACVSGWIPSVWTISMPSQGSHCQEAGLGSEAQTPTQALCWCHDLLSVTHQLLKDDISAQDGAWPLAKEGQKEMFQGTRPTRRGQDTRIDRDLDNKPLFRVLKFVCTCDYTSFCSTRGQNDFGGKWTMVLHVCNYEFWTLYIW